MTARPQPEERIRDACEHETLNWPLLKTLFAQIDWQAARIQRLEALVSSLRTRLEMHGEKFIFEGDPGYARADQRGG